MLEMHVIIVNYLMDVHLSHANKGYLLTLLKQCEINSQVFSLRCVSCPGVDDIQLLAHMLTHRSAKQ